jgi:hypothetical protein
MNQINSKKPFLPRDKPRSWIVAIICGLIGVLVAGPLAIAGITFEISALKEAGTLLFWCSWMVAISMGAVFLSKTIAGRYKSIEARDWSEQVW